MKSKSTAGLLAFFLGGFGVHRFYLGQIGRGFIYLIFCWTFVPAVIALIDAIVFWTMSAERFNEKYNQEARQFLTANRVSPAQELEHLANLRDRGVITDAEFQFKKRQLL